MRPKLIWKVAMALLTMAAPSVSATRQLFTSTIEYCSTEQIILVNKFDIVFYPGNSSVAFNVVANSVQNAVSAELSFSINAYSLAPIGYTIDLCSLANGILCPLPAYQFNGSAEYFVPQNYISHIPSLAYYVPDLEASATVRILDKTSGSSVACIKTYLSNGLTTKHAYVSWATGVVVILALILALVHPYYPLSPSRSAPDYRLLTIVQWLQFMAIGGMLSVDYPQSLLAFARNFAWSWGLIYIGPLQRSMESTVVNSGGHLNDTLSAIEVSQQVSSKSTKTTTGALSIPGIDVSKNSTLGLDRYLQELRLRPATAFANSLVVFLLLAAILAILSVLLWLLFSFTGPQQRASGSTGKATINEKSSSAESLTKQGAGRPWQALQDYCTLNVLRWFLVVCFPLMALAVYSFRDSDQTGSGFIALAAVFFIFLLLSMGLIGLSVRRIIKNDPDGADGVYESQRQRKRYGALFHQFKRRRVWFVWLLAACMILRAVFIGAGQRSPWAQLVPLMLIELLLFLCICAFKPHSSKGSNILDGFLAAVRLVCLGIMIAFVPSINTNRIVATVLGLVILAIQSIVFLILFGIFLVHSIKGIVWFCRVRPDKKGSSHRAKTKSGKTPLDPASALQLSMTPISAGTEERRAGSSNHSSATLIDPVGVAMDNKTSPDRKSPGAWPSVPSHFDTEPTRNYPDTVNRAAPPLPEAASRKKSTIPGQAQPTAALLSPTQPSNQHILPGNDDPYLSRPMPAVPSVGRPLASPPLAHSQSFTVAYHPTEQHSFHQRSVSFDVPSSATRSPFANNGIQTFGSASALSTASLSLAATQDEEPRPSSMYVSTIQSEPPRPVFPASVPDPYIAERSRAVSSVLPDLVPPRPHSLQFSTFGSEPQSIQPSDGQQPQFLADSPRISPSTRYLVPDSWENSPQSLQHPSPTATRMPSPLTPRRVPLPPSPWAQTPDQRST